MAFSRFLEQKRTIGVALETTPYTRETLTAANFNIAAYDVKYTPNIPPYQRKLAKGTFSRSVSISGKRSMEVTFKVDMHAGATATTPADYFLLLRCCGLKQLIGPAGVKLVPDCQYSRTPCSIEVVERQEGASPSQMVIPVPGAMGDAALVMGETGQPIAIEFRFLGRYEQPETRLYAAMLTPTAFDTGVPPAVLAATINLFGTTQFINTMRLALNNQLEMFTDPAYAGGYEGCHIIDRNPSLEMDRDMRLPSDVDAYAAQVGNTTGALAITVGSNLYITAPAAQYEKANDPGSREGHVTDQITCGLREGAVGGDEFEIRQGASF